MAFLPVLTLAATAASAGIAAYGMYQQGQAQAASARYQQSVALVNQQIQSRNAEYAQVAGQVGQQERQMQQGQQRSRLIAQQGAQGLDVLGGSAADVQRGQRLGIAQTGDIMQADTSRKAQAFQIAALGEGAQANIYGGEAQQAVTAGDLGATGSLISGVSNVSDKWLRYNRMGMFGSPASNSFGLGGSAGAIY